MSRNQLLSLLQGAAEKLGACLALVPFAAPLIPVIHNASVASAPTPEAIRAILTRQAASPVRWVETIEYFALEGVTQLAECGPGKVLAGLNKRIAGGMTVFALTDATAIDAARTTLFS